MYTNQWFQILPAQNHIAYLGQWKFVDLQKFHWFCGKIIQRTTATKNLCYYVSTSKRNVIKIRRRFKNYELYQKLFSVSKIFVLNLKSRIFQIYCANEFKFLLYPLIKEIFQKKGDKLQIAFWNLKSISFIITLGKTGACCLTMTSRTKLK